MSTSGPRITAGSRDRCWPNGLAAAVTLARAGVPVTVFEAAETIGGGTRTTSRAARSAARRVLGDSPDGTMGFFREFELARRVEFAVPEASARKPTRRCRWRRCRRGAGRAAIAYRDLARTASELGRDGGAYARFYRPLLRHLEGVVDFALGPSMLRLPRDPVAALVTRAAHVFEQGTPLWGARFSEAAAPALLSGVAAHSIGRMPNLATAGVGAVLGALGHATGSPAPIGGSRAISDALAADRGTRRQGRRRSPDRRRARARRVRREALRHLCARPREYRGARAARPVPARAHALHLRRRSDQSRLRCSTGRFRGPTAVLPPRRPCISAGLGPRPPPPSSR